MIRSIPNPSFRMMRTYLFQLSQTAVVKPIRHFILGKPWDSITMIAKQICLGSTRRFHIYIYTDIYIYIFVQASTFKLSKFEGSYFWCTLGHLSVYTFPLETKRLHHQNIPRYIQIYIQHVQNTRRRPGGGSPAGPRAAGFGYIWYVGHLFFTLLFGMVTPKGHIWSKATSCIVSGYLRPAARRRFFPGADGTS